MDNVIIWDIIGKHLNHQTTAEEEKTLEEWLSTSKANQSLFQESKKLWEAGEKVNYKMEVDVDQEWDNLKSLMKDEDVIDQGPIATNVRSIQPRNPLNMVYKVAAGLLILLVASFIYFKANQVEDKWVTQTATNEPAEVSLPDGSHIWLNSNSSLTWIENNFSKSRHVILEGEGYFEVVSAKEYPFTITAGKSLTTVVGTAFNIDATNPAEKVELVVMSGKVTFGDSKDNSKVISLVKGEKGIYDSNTGELKNRHHEGSNFISWKTAKLNFENVPMSVVIADCEKHFGIKISVSSNNILACNYTGNFDAPTLENVMTVIASALNLSFEHRGNTISFNGEGCSKSD